MAVFLTTSMRDVPDVGSQPSFDLSDWAVMRTSNGTRFLVGRSENGSSMRVSTPLVEFDEFAMTGVTASGRKYRLVGEPRPNPLEDLTFRVFAASQGMDLEGMSVVDVATPPTLRN